MKIEARKTGEQTLITLSGELNVRFIAQLKNSLEEIIGSSDEVGIDFDDVQAADLALLQLLCSAGQTARAAGKKLTVQGEIPDVIARLFTGTGFHNHGSYSDHECIWNRVDIGEAS